MNTHWLLRQCVVPFCNYNQATNIVFFILLDRKKKVHRRMSSSKASPASRVTKQIPGSYGLPVLGSQSDRLDFYYHQGEVEFFKSRVEKYKSTIFKVNFNPGPPGFPSPEGVALLDQKSFPVLFDSALVAKADVFVGPFKPDDAFTGGFRTLAYLDTEESLHKPLKSYIFEILKSCGPRFLPEFESSFRNSFAKVEAEIESKGEEANAVERLEGMAFEFLVKSILQADPSDELGSDGASLLKTWIGVQFAPIAPAGASGLPSLVEDAMMRQFPLPYFTVKSGYEKLCDFFRKHGAQILEMGAKQFNLDSEEALHNLVFVVGINGWLGFSRLLPSLIYYAATMGSHFQVQLGEEIRSAMADSGYSTSAANAWKGYMSAVDKMPLLKSFVIEVLRFAPPVLYQYGRARTDFVVESHDAAFQINKGTLLGGSQALVCRDPKVFDNPESFIPDRFLGKEKSKLAAYVFWSNGRHTDSPTLDNKQCGGKDFVETIARFFLVQLFLRYESIELSADAKPAKFAIRSVKKVAAE